MAHGLDDDVESLLQPLLTYLSVPVHLPDRDELQQYILDDDQVL